MGWPGDGPAQQHPNREADMADTGDMTDDEYDDWRWNRFAERLLGEPADDGGEEE